MERLTLNDASVVVKRENSDALGAGFRCGFLGGLGDTLTPLESRHAVGWMLKCFSKLNKDNIGMCVLCMCDCCGM
jgi:hypothetical protein